MPGWILWPRFLNNHITAPHANAANTEKCRESGGTGRARVDPSGEGAFEYGVPARGKNAAITLETT